MNVCFWQYLLPQHLLSRLFGYLAYCEIPWFKNFAIKTFSFRHPVNMEEAAHSNLSAYPHFNAFFTRTLKPGIRNIDGDPLGFVSPVDGTISAFGTIEKGQIIQAKNHYYSISALLGTNDEPTLYSYEGGIYATLYLAPHDYHRVHMPIDGTLTGLRYIPGRLFSVNQQSANVIPNLFARNERVILFFDTEFGPLALVLVGAMIVASISTVFAGLIAPNNNALLERAYTSTQEEKICFKKGEEIAYFHLGSTVIALLGNKKIQWDSSLTSATPIQLGQLLAKL